MAAMTGLWAGSPGSFLACYSVRRHELEGPWAGFTDLARRPRECKDTGHGNRHPRAERAAIQHTATRPYGRHRAVRHRPASDAAQTRVAHAEQASRHRERGLGDHQLPDRRNARLRRSWLADLTVDRDGCRPAAR